MPHSCEILLPDYVEKKFESLGYRSSFRKRWLKLLVISETNPLACLYFKSEKSMRKEQLRQISSGYTYIIHPLSKFRQWYEVYLLLFYVMMLIVKPLDTCIKRFKITARHRTVSVALDFLSFVDIVTNFFTGYIVTKTKTIELDPWKIAKNYVFGPFFVSDVLGSMKFLIFLGMEHPPLIFIGIQNIFCFSRAIRVWTLMKLILRVSALTNIKSKTTLFTICCISLFLFILHFFTCLVIGLKIIIRYNFQAPDPENTSDINVYEEYIDYMFRSSAYLLGITLPQVYFEEHFKKPEDFVTAVFGYLVGKILIISTWIIIALSILANRSTQIKYQKIMNELEEYMIQKQLPINLRKKITTYYHFKYQGSYFKEDLITYLLSDNLKKDINMGICRYLISNVSIFKELSKDQVSDIVQVLISEIFLPNDAIIQAGTIGEAMYFLASGTVAVYTHSGKEICHLQDGAYFGEISLVVKGQKRSASISAVEICHIYRLKKSDFQKTLMKYRQIYQSIINTAEMRLKETSHVEETYKKTLFEETYTDSTVREQLQSQH
ncbi:potassium/sodium hyperpolarization-activated cyclic nucleotide-gated channel 2-like [Diabrotica undecimpunctata]|uniref:potassium/sodium hyperpolarization-activated cyclic nucleotide-gated channel 2-like n=1 Tax=Diabrotica undecimpunctata TaxID=50387 RepID=UPI003B63F3A9